MPTATELNINTTVDATDLANEIFGSGINVTSATIAGDAVQYGSYSGGETTSGGVVPSDGGVILSTGNVTDFTNSDGTVNTNTAPGTSTPTTNGVDGDAQLDAIAGVATFDGVIFEATFVPTGDFITMQFVFSSEEYLEYVNGGVNDAVGVWVNGTFAPLTPSGDTVSIDTVNDASNQNLYVDNPEATDPYNTEMDGFTVTMSLKAPVNSGQPNTIKIGLADGGDDAFDSNLLIAGDSIQTFALAMTDEVTLLPNDSRVVDVLANDVDQTGGGLTITEINGQAVSAGDTVILATGESVTLNADGTLTVQSDGDVIASSLTYTVIDSAGNTDVGYLTINTANTVSPDGTVEGSAGDDVINAGYLGDPNGDFVDANDGLGAQGTVGNDDLIYAYDGNDDVDSGEGNDIVFAGAGDDDVFAGNNDDIVYGGDGTDSLAGQSGNDELYGGDGNDYVDGDSGSDTLSGDAGNDVIVADGGNDTMYGGTGDDGLYMSSGDNLAYGDAGNDSLFGDAGTDELYGGDGTDQLYGGANDDILSGDADTDSIYGGADNDSLLGGEGADTLDGGTGDDTLLGDATLLNVGDYASTTSGAASDLTVVNNADGPIELWWIDETGTLQQYATIQPGGSFVQPTFSDHNWVLQDEDGNLLKLIEGAENQTVVYGDESLSDNLSGGDGNDTIDGQFGDDYIDGGAGNDIVFGGTGDDSASGGAGDDTLYGGDGNDTLAAGNNTGVGDALYGGAGDDELTDSFWNATLDGGDGADIINAGFGTATIVGGEGGTDFDTLSFADADDPVTVTFDGDEQGVYVDSDGDDGIFSEIEAFELTSGNDTLDASADGSGISVFAGGGSDVVTGGTGGDTIDGGTGNDTLYAGLGSDTLFGGDGDDLLIRDGTDADDTLNVLSGGAGNDTIRLEGGINANDQIDGGDGVDTLEILPGDDRDLTVDMVAGTVADGTIGTQEFVNIENITTGGGNDTILGNALDNELIGGAGDDSTDGGAGNDSISGGDGNDTIAGGAGADTLDGGTGNNTLDYSDSVGSFTANLETNSVFGSDADGDVISNFQNIIGSDFGDTITLSADDGIIYAGTGSDFLQGGDGNDSILANDGDDVIDGGAGNDALLGEGGDDTFQLTDGFGDDSIVGGETSETSGDTLNASSLSSGVTVTLTSAEAGTLVNGTDTATFSEIEQLNLTSFDDTVDAGATTTGISVDTGGGDDSITGGSGDDSVAAGLGDDVIDLGAGNDTLDLGDGGGPDGDGDTIVLENGDGGDVIFNFDAPLPNGSGGFIGTDVFDVSGMTDAGGDPVDTNDVTVGDDGSGNAVLSFPNGESVTLIGVDPVTADDPFWLNAAGIPLPNGTVEGTAGDDLIDDTYTGDPDGDMVDAGDAVLSGDTGNDDLIYGYGGNDSINAGDGNDEVYGGDDADVISGGAGDDTLFGDAGDDLIEAGTGNDTVFGGTGTDQITITEDDGTDIAAGGESAGDDDSIVFFEDGATGIDVSMTGNEAGDYLFVSGNGDGSFTEIETVNMTNQDDTYDGTATTSGMGVVAGEGDDSLIGGSGSDTLQGDAGADTIAGNGGDDIVSAGTGDDLIQIGDNHGNDTVFGGEDVGDGDTDTLDLYENGSGQGVTVEFTGDEAGTSDFDGTTSSGSFQQMEVIDGTQADDTLDAGADTGGVTLFGNAGTDTITGGQGNDQLSGGADEDTFLVEDNFGSDTIIGGQTGTNYDTIDLSALTNPVTVSFTGPGAGSITDQITGDTIVFSQVEQLILTDQADVVDATNDNGYTYIQTLEGDDSVLGSAGDDVIDEEIGVGPTLDGEGNDTFFGEAGNDEIWAGNDDDLVYGGTGNDTLNGQAGNDTVFGGDGNDEVNGGGGDDVLLGDAGDDTISGDGGDDIFDLTGGGNDTVIGGESGETEGDVLSTGSYTGNSTVDLTAGGTGADPESGTITTTEGTTTFSEIEIVSTGVGDDSVIGSSGDDNVATGEGADTVDAGAGNDEIDLGGSFVSVGNDVVYEGDGDADTIILQDGDGQDEINGFDAPTDNGDGTYTGIDQIDVSGLTDDLGNPVYTSDVTVTDDGAGNAVLTFPNGEQLTLFGVDPVYVDDPFVLNAMGIPIADGTVSGTAGNDTIDAGYTGDPDGDLVDANDALLPGDTGNDDVINAGAGDDSILAGDGNDEIGGGTGNDTIDGGTGDDLVYSGADADVVFGGEGNDSIFTQEGDDIAYGGAGNDYFETWIGNDTVYGGGGDDTIDGAEGNDTLYGDAGNDFLMGGNNGGEDELYGGDGDDTLWSGDGNDIVEGGTGNDNIDASGGDDTILLNSGFGDDDITAGETGETTGDTLDAQGVTEDATLDLNALFAGNPESGTISDGTSTASFIEVENIDLGGGDDTVIGSSGDDSVNAGLGADTLDGGAGNDTFDLGGFEFFGSDAAQDTVVLQDGSGDDTLLNFEGPIDNGDGTYTPGDVFDVTALTDAGGNPVHTTDVTVGDDGSGNAVLSFPNGESVTLIGVAPADVDDPFALNAMGIPLPDGTIDGTAGNDVIDTGYTSDPDGDVVDGNDAILPGDSGNDDVIDAGAGNDTILAGDGDDYVEADEGDDTVYGGDGNDSIFGFEGSDTVEGGDGDDYINTRTSPGTGLPDEAYPGGGFPDDPDPTNDMDSVSGGAGNDEILTGDDNDIVYGGTGGDSIDAGFDDDLVFGGTGDDFISGNEGADTLSGEDGDDTIYGDDATGTYSALDIPDDTDLQPDNQIDTIYGGAGNDTIFGMDDADVLYGGTGNDVIDGGIDDDSLFGGEGADSLSGGDGADTITFAEGDTAEGGAGDDLFILEDLGEPTNGTITIDGGSEDSADTLQLGSLGGLTQAVQDSFVDDGTGSFSGTITLDDGTILNFSEIENIICFTPGTRIATPRGQRPIEELKVGDLVVTRDHGLQPIRWIQSRTVPAIDRFAPVRIRPGVVTGLETDLLVSPQHRMLFQGYQAELLFGDSEMLVAATHLVDGLDVTTETGGTVTYIHMMFDQHEIIYAEGAASESFHPGEIGLSAVSDPAREELFALFPELRSDPRHYGQTARKCLKKHEAQLIRF